MLSASQELRSRNLERAVSAYKQGNSELSRSAHSINANKTKVEEEPHKRYY